MSKLSENLKHFALNLTEDASAHSLELSDRARELESEVERLNEGMRLYHERCMGEMLRRERAEAEVERLRVSCTGMRKAMEHAETRELAALGELDTYRAAVAELRKWYLVSGSTCTMTRIFDKLPK